MALWDLGLRWHVSGAAGVLLILAAYVNPSQGCIFDEGACALQAKSLAEHATWKVPDQAQWIDPTGASNPLWRDDTALNRRHPFYPWVLSVMYRVFGTFGFVIPSLLGTVVAGVSSWLLLDSLSDRWRRAGFWLTVLFSPLLFYSPLIFGHTLGAGAGGLALYALLKWTSGSSHKWLAAGLGSSCLLFSVRTEGVLLIGAMGVVLCAEAVRNRSARWRNLVASVACGVIFVAVRLLENRVRAEALGSSGDGGRSVGDFSHDDSIRKVVGAFMTLFGAGPNRHWTNFCVLASVLIVPIVSRLLRDGVWKTAACLGAILALSYVSWAFSRQRMFVSGIVVTAPVLWFGIWCLRMDRLGRDQRLLAWIASIFLVAVLVTQYPVGSSLEWGGRYLAVGLPMFSALAVTGLATLFAVAPRRARCVTAALAVGVSLLVLAIEVDVLKTYHLSTNETSQLLTRVGERANGGTFHPINGNRPIILTNNPFLPVIDWPVFERFNWIQTRERTPEFYLQRLRDHKVEGFVLAEVGDPSAGFGRLLEPFGYKIRDSKVFRNFTVYLITSTGG